MRDPIPGSDFPAPLNIDLRYSPESPSADSTLPHVLRVVLVAVFIGFLLTLAVSYGASALLDPAGLVPEYYDGAPHEDIALRGFSDTFYRAPTLRRGIARYDFLLYGNLPDEDIILGKQGFLFELRGRRDDYDFIADYLGENNDEARLIASDLLTEGEKYSSRGIECIFVVIPNTQTVYFDRMPDFFRDISPDTRLCRLSSLVETGAIPGLSYLDLTEILRAGKLYGPVYNNTENSLNSRGAYFVYREVFEQLPASVAAGLEPIEYDALEFVTRRTVGKELARRVGLEEDIRNVTVSLSDGFVENFDVTDVIGDLLVTRSRTIPEENDASRRPVLFKFTNDWDRVLLSDYFSNTLDVAAYSPDPTFDEAELAAVRPAAVVFFLHENEVNLFSGGAK